MNGQKGGDVVLDQTDVRILEELSKNSRITMKELGEKVHLTGQAAATRVAKLEDQGVIEGYTINMNQSKIGCQVHAMITIFTQSQHHKPYLDFIEAYKQNMLNHYKISGEGCYMLETRFPSNEALDRFLVKLNEHANYKLNIIINQL